LGSSQIYFHHSIFNTCFATNLLVALLSILVLRLVVFIKIEFLGIKLTFIILLIKLARVESFSRVSKATKTWLSLEGAQVACLEGALVENAATSILNLFLVSFSQLGTFKLILNSHLVRRLLREVTEAEPALQLFVICRLTRLFVPVLINKLFTWRQIFFAMVVKFEKGAQIRLKVVKPVIIFLTIVEPARDLDAIFLEAFIEK